MTMLVSTALIGIGCAPVLMASMFVFGRAYPPERFAILSSMILGIGALGVLAAATPLAYAVEAFGWRASLASMGGVTAGATAAVYLLIKDPPLVLCALHHEASAWRDLVSIMALKPLWPLIPLPSSPTPRSRPSAASGSALICSKGTGWIPSRAATASSRCRSPCRRARSSTVPPSG